MQENDNRLTKRNRIIVGLSIIIIIALLHILRVGSYLRGDLYLLYYTLILFMNYTLHQLQIFLKITELKSITKASEVLHLTQPAVSIQLKNFQNQFDIPLTEVVGRKIYITDFGKEIAEAAENILNQVYAINYKTLAFKDFNLIRNPTTYEFSTIDMTRKRSIPKTSDYFSLIEFSAKWDPVPTMLTQNHTTLVKGFMGQTTSFDRNTVKTNVLVLGENRTNREARYIHGTKGKGMFTFYGGHDPEDYTHRIGDPKTELDLHPTSPGYRLILNNVLFPAAKKKKQKT